MANLNEIMENLKNLLDEYEERLEDRADEIKDEVEENIKSEVEDLADDIDLLNFINDYCNGDVHQMDEYEFNDYIDNEGISAWDLIDIGFSQGDMFFGKDSAEDFRSSDDLTDFINLDDVVTGIIDRDEDLGESSIREELDKLKNPEEGIYDEFIVDLKKILGLEDKKEEVNQESNDDLAKVIDWIYEHKMLGEDFDNKFPKLAEKYKED